MKVIADSAIPYLKGVLEPYADVTYLPASGIDADAVRQADALLVRTRTRCDKGLLEGSRVKFVATATAGTDHIDISWCAANGIETASAPGCNACGVVQYLYTALFQMAEVRGIRLKGKRLGIIGAGNVGGRVAAMAGLFGLEPIVCDPPRAALEGGEGFASLDELLACSDIVTLHVPLDDTTRSMVDANFFRRMLKKAIFVNASRGEILVEGDLLGFLDKFAAVSLDVWRNEPDIDRTLADAVDIATPHIAGYSLAGKVNATKATVRAFARFAKIQALESFDPAESMDRELLYRKLDVSAVSQSELARRLIDIYPIASDSAALKSAPQLFEKLRTEYQYRAELYV